MVTLFLFSPENKVIKSFIGSSRGTFFCSNNYMATGVVAITLVKEAKSYIDCE